MPGYNNYQNYGNYANYPVQNQYVGMRNTNTVPQQSMPNYGYPQPQMTQAQDNRFQLVDYVSGRAGADAYQLPNGVNNAILFDNDNQRFYIKGYDNNGRPRVLEDNDFNPHVEPEPQPVQANIDLTAYATKDDIKDMITNVISNLSIPNVSNYVTRKEFYKSLSELTDGGSERNVKNNESNA